LAQRCDSLSGAPAGKVLALEEAIRSGEHEANPAVTRPPDDVRGSTLVTLDLEDLSLPIGIADPVSSDNQPISDLCAHGFHGIHPSIVLVQPSVR
jgi:hypothetical protein